MVLPIAFKQLAYAGFKLLQQFTTDCEICCFKVACEVI